MSDSILMNPLIPTKYHEHISPQFQSEKMMIYNELPSLNTMDDADFSDNEYDMSPKGDDAPSPSKKRGRGAIQNGIRRSPNKWTKEENQKLFELVHMYGEKKWKRISAEMGGQKTGAQCAQHWKRVLSPDIRKGPWDEDEEELLLRLVNQHGSSWKKIAKRICKRTDIQCRYQYLKSLQSREVPWVTKEDEVLIRKVQEMGDNLSWLEVSDFLAKLKHTNTLRTALECKTRYMQLTNTQFPSAITSITTPSSSLSSSSSTSTTPSSSSSTINIIQTLNTNSAPSSLNSSSSSILNSSSNNTFSKSGHSLSPLSHLIDSNNSSPSFESCNEEQSSSPPNVYYKPPSNNNSNIPLYKPTPHKATISHLTSPNSSPIHSPPLSPLPSNSLFEINNNCNNNNNNNSKSSICLKNNSFSINNLIDSHHKEEDHEPQVKKVRSNGEFYYQPTNMIFKQQPFNNNSDTSSDDDINTKKFNQLTNINNNNSFNNSVNNKINFTYNSSGSTSPSSSPISSPTHSPSLQKLKATSFDFFNLESLAAIASTAKRHIEIS